MDWTGHNICQPLIITIHNASQSPLRFPIFLFQSSKSESDFLLSSSSSSLTSIFYCMTLRSQNCIFIPYDIELEPSLVFRSPSRAEPRVGLGSVDLWLGSTRLGSARWQHW